MVIFKRYKEQIDAFSEYSTNSNFTYNSTDGVWSFSGTDLYRTIGLSLVNAQNKENRYEEIAKGYELNNLINSKINPPTLTYPIYVKIGQSYKVYPINHRAKSRDAIY
jgi:hypothetical protein